MSLYRWYGVACDLCGNWTQVTSDTSAEARKVARRRDWVRRDRTNDDPGRWTAKVDICPACSATEDGDR